MGYKIISGRYETGTQEQQMGYNQLFGNEKLLSKNLFCNFLKIAR